MSMVECRDVSKQYANGVTVSGISFRVERGECVALCGGNGAGKSTVLNMLVGNLAPTSGSIVINGCPVTPEEKAFRRHIGYMPDHLNFPRALTGREILSFYADLCGRSARDVDACLEKVGLAHAANRKAGEYSKGMTQRLLLAQAILHQPPLLLLDEPTNGLDPFWVVTYKQMIRELKDQGTTIVLSSHIMRDVEELADRVVIIDAGRLVAVDTIDALTRAWAPQTGKFEDAFFALLIEHRKQLENVG